MQSYYYHNQNIKQQDYNLCLSVLTAIFQVNLG